MDEENILPPMLSLDDLAEQEITPFTRKEMDDATAKINLMVAPPDPPTPRLQTRMNPSGGVPVPGLDIAHSFRGASRSGSPIGAVQGGMALRGASWPDSDDRKVLVKDSQKGGLEGHIASEALRKKDELFARRDPEADMATVIDQLAYDHAPTSVTPTSVAATVAATIADPSILIGLPAKASLALGQTIKGVLPSAGPGIQRAMIAGADAAFGNVITDPIVQGINVASGAQKDYDVSQTLLAVPLGFVAGAAIRGGIDLATGARVAPAPGEAPAARVGDEAPLLAQTAQAPVAARQGVDLPDAAIPARVEPSPVPRADVAAEPAISARAADETISAVPEATPRRGVRATLARIKAGEDAQASALRAGAGEASEALDGVQAMAVRSVMPGPDATFPRRILAGEDSKPVALPKDATPDEIHAFRVTEAIGDLAAALGRAVSLDGRFTARNALGEYKLKDGTIRLRYAGDFEVFAHEAGHAVDADLRRTLGKDWADVLDTHKNELTPLDANATDPAKKTLREGTAEFLRMFINNPAYAAKQAPNFAADFERFIDTKAPNLRGWFDQAQRASQIDSGLSPIQRMESMVVSASDQLAKQGGVGGGSYKWTWREVQNTYRKEGLWITVGDVFNHFKADYMGNRNVRVEALRRAIADAAYERTGKPLPKAFTWADPLTIAKELPGANQVALDQIQKGIRPFGSVTTDRETMGLTDALRRALGDPAKAFDDADPMGRAFSGYLVARVGERRYIDYRNGEIPNPPIRATQNEVTKAVADYDALHPNFRAAADIVSEFNLAMLRKEVDAGITKKSVLDEIEAKGNPFYVPLNRDMDDMLRGGGGSGSPSSMSSVKQLKGSTRDVINPVHRMVQKMIALENNIGLNQFWKAMDGLAQMAGELGGQFMRRIPNTEVKAISVDAEAAIRDIGKQRGMTTEEIDDILRQIPDFIGEDTTATVFKRGEILPTGERIVYMFEGGQRVPMVLGNDVNSRALFEVMAGMGSAERDLFMGVFGRASTYFSATITSAPQFLLGNAIADGLTRAFVSRNVSLGYRVGSLLSVGLYPAMRGYWTMAFNKDFAQRYAALGGQSGGMVSHAAREASAEKGFQGVVKFDKGVTGLAEDAIAYLTKPGRSIGQIAADTALIPVRAPIALVKAMFRVTETSETAGRLGQARAVYDYLKKQGYNDADATLGMMAEARSIMDYSQVGASMTALRRFFTFLNPGIQGVAVANNRMFMEPGRAVKQYMDRGKDWTKVDPELRQAFNDGLIGNGILLAVAGGLVPAYHAWVNEHPTYKRASSYMKDRYFIIPFGDGEGDYISIRKPFDIAGSLISSVEHFLSGQKNANPEEYAKIAKSLAEGFLPRQFTSVEDFVGGNFLIKFGAENVTGKTIPFGGGESRDIVPERLQTRAPEDQFTARTSLMAKEVGAATRVSPMKIDHAVSTLAGTLGRDANDMLTATFGQNPNMTPSDAAKKMFLGNIYRAQNGIGEPGNALMNVMRRDGGKYMVEANSYEGFLKAGRPDKAQERYNRANDITKTLMVLKSNKFAPVERQLHPLYRANEIMSIVNSMSRDLSEQRVWVEDRSLKPGESKEEIVVDFKTAKALTLKLNAMAAEDIVSALSLAKVPGYANMPVIDTAPRLKMIRDLSPEVADELEARIEKKHIQPAADVAKNWPEVQRRLLTDQGGAKFRDLLPTGTKLPRDRR